MLYVIYGTDTHKARAKLHDLLALAQKKRPNAELFKINTETFSEGQLDELLVSRGLFENKYTVVLDNLFEKKDRKDFILDRLDSIKDSEQIFLMLESSIDAKTLAKLSKKAEKVQELIKKEDKNFTPNIFSINDGLLQRDKRKLWISYLNFIKQGFAVEELHGILFWQVKNMILASRGDNDSSTGLSPFVYKNALTGARKYKTEELFSMSSFLVDMTHKVRRGEGDLETMLEKWVLSI